jgi:hypothetical protein
MNRNSIVDFVGRLRAKPEHVRQRIALGTAVGTTAVVAVVWLLVLASSGVLVVNPAGNPPGTLAQNSNPQIEQANAQAKNGFQNLLGAVGFSFASSSPPALDVVGESTSPAPSDQSDNSQSPTGGDQTVIPF